MNYQRIISAIEGEYNPEYDLIRDAPRVTWADASLLELVKDLYERIEKLEAELAERPTWEQLAEKESLLSQQDY